MGGGVLQLVAFGAQDLYLTGNPQITYFKVFIDDILISQWNLLNKEQLEMHILVILRI